MSQLEKMQKLFDVLGITYEIDDLFEISLDENLVTGLIIHDTTYYACDVEIYFFFSRDGSYKGMCVV